MLCLLSAGLATAQVKQAELAAVPGCTWVAGSNNDGDSFQLRAGTNVMTVRLYDVDCAEVKSTTAARHAAQTNFFGADGARLREIGRQAAGFTSNELTRPFGIITRYARSFGGERVLVYVITADGADLGALLVSNRLARPHGGRYNPPPAPLVQKAIAK